MKSVNKKPKFPITLKDRELVELVQKTDKKTLAVWAYDCAMRVLPYFEQKYPDDNRPRTALETLQTWIDTGLFKMSVIRKASLDSHAAARETAEDNEARSAGRAAGQAVATAHVSIHALGPALYAQQAVYRASDFSSAETAVAKERDWQYRRLLKLRKNEDNKV